MEQNVFYAWNVLEIVQRMHFRTGKKLPHEKKGPAYSHCKPGLAFAELNSIDVIGFSRGGIELGQPTQDKKAADEALSLAEFDFVLGSLHNLKGEKDFYFLNYTPENCSGLLDRYFNELLELAQSNCFDSLAHITYPFRYIYANPDINADVMQYAQQLDAVLETLIKNDKALEVNTSGLRQLIGTTLPDENVIRRFRELGGRYVTLGSDAHRWGDVGAGIEDGLNLLLKCGFTHFTVYSKREPVMLPVI